MENWEDEKQPLNWHKIKKGNMNSALEAKLNKKYTANARIDEVFKGNDITFYTNELGEPVKLYIGKRKENGNISGECYFRRIKKRVGNEIEESHWDNQGKVSGKTTQ